ncbi:hypothetical protein PHYC_03181 [Phycisphaerales bacterium]|nr:hypothetical protein PHYC_03181 [Phycisphaerales bacterium]
MSTAARLASLVALVCTPALLAQVTFQTAAQTAAQSQPPRRFIPSGPTWGVGAGRMNINLLSTKRFETWDPSPPVVIIPPRHCPPRPIPCPPRPCTTVTTSGSGLTVDGQYTGEKWNVGFHVGGPTFSSTTCGDTVSTCAQPLNCFPVAYGTPYWPRYGSYWNTGIDSVVLYRDRGPLDPQFFQEQPLAQPAAPQTAQPTEPPTSLDVGIASIQSRSFDEGVSALRRHLRESPDDARAMRALALALIETKDLDDAAAVMRQAYRTDPKLADEPIVPPSLAYTDRRFRDLVNRAVTHAHKINSASSWLLVCTLMHAEGRNDVALAQLDKAKKVGLEPETYDALAVELKR